jgi:DNA-binding NarL/FixJ family response regulator
VFATEQPLLIAGLRELLRHAGLTSDLSVVMPEALNGNLGPDETSLVLLEGQFQNSWETIVEARRRALRSRFVLLGVDITPQLIHAALEAGLHGVLSTTLPLEESAQGLVQICRGERQFRFGSPARRSLPPRRLDPLAIPFWTQSDGKEAAA